MSRPSLPRRRARVALMLALAMALTALTGSRSFAAAPQDDAERPRLVVVVAVPGLRADYLERCLPHLGPMGIRRALRRGARFTGARTGLAFPGAESSTATLVTGAWPRDHGVVGARWWDRETGAETGPPAAAALRPTLADRLEKASDGAAETLVVAWSEAVARLAAGTGADTCCWFDPEALTFRARTAGAAAAKAVKDESADPEWLTRYRTTRKLRRWSGKEWVRYLPRWRYADCAEDDRVGEGGGGLGATFPHALPEADAALAGVVPFTPFADRLLFEVAVTAILSGTIGRDDVPDLLVLVPESLGRIGERFGPESHEVADGLARFDLQLGLFLSVLDTRVGPGRWTLFLTGLHGVPPLPAEASARGLVTRTLTPSVRALPPSPILAPANEEPGIEEPGVDPQVPEALRFESEREPMIWLGPQLFARRDAWPGAGPAATVITATHHRLLRAPGVHAVLTRAHFRDDRLPPGRLGRVLRRSYHPQHSGDLIVVLSPHAGWTGMRGPTGPWPHSDAIAMIAMGHGVRRGIFDAPVTLASVAPMVGGLLGLSIRTEPDAGQADGALRDRPEGDSR